MAACDNPWSGKNSGMICELLDALEGVRCDLESLRWLSLMDIIEQDDGFARRRCNAATEARKTLRRAREWQPTR